MLEIPLLERFIPMKDMTVLPCEMPIMDDDETPYVPLWRVMVNGKPHREVLEEGEMPLPNTATPMVVPSKSIH